MLKQPTLGLASAGRYWERLGLAEQQIADKKIKQRSFVLGAALFKNLGNANSFADSAAGVQMPGRPSGSKYRNLLPIPAFLAGGAS
jgi:hypothetical protein